jgi:hypothetical protein
MLVEAIMDELVALEPTFAKEPNRVWPTIRALIPDELSIQIRFHITDATLVAHAFFLNRFTYDLNDPTFSIEEIWKSLKRMINDYTQWRKGNPELPLYCFDYPAT